MKRLLGYFRLPKSRTKTSSKPPLVGPNATNPRVDTTISVLQTVASLTKDASEALAGVPFVKAVAGVITQLLKIVEVRIACVSIDLNTYAKQELRANKERQEELFAVMIDKTNLVVEHLDQFRESEESFNGSSIQLALERYLR